MTRRLDVVVGAQFGSEAKGHIVQRIVERSQRSDLMPHVVRVAGPNAGHTGYDRTGRAWALRQVPVAAVTEGPATLEIAPGSEIDPPVLMDEIRRLTEAGLMDNKVLTVSSEATIISDWHKEQETTGAVHGGGDLVHRIGSTGKGIGAARAARLMRKADRVRDNQAVAGELRDLRVIITNPDMRPFVEPDHIVIEGTQGYGLGLRAGFYPFCTSSDCRAIDFCAMAGLNPTEFDAYQVWAVARMFPIRVAGNSGPLRNETTWEALGLPPEFTTVTKKMRRVGYPDWDLVRKAVEANGRRNTVVALTMVDQAFKFAAGTPIDDLGDIDQEHEVNEFVEDLEETIGVKIPIVTTGPNTATWRI